MYDRLDHGKASRLLREQGGYLNLIDGDRDYVHKMRDSVRAHYDSRVEAAVKQGVPTTGNDGYVEFALRPRYDPQDILRDVQILQDLDLIRDNEHYPLHLTIGGIAVNGSAFYLLSSTEIAGNIRPGRFTQRNTWAQKGRGGIKWRFPHELQLGTTEGVEFRTLEYTSMNQLADILHVAQMGSRAIIDKHPLWQSWRQQLADHLAEAELPANAIWQNADYDLWQRYADTLSNNDWQQEAQRIVGRHAALLSVVHPKASAPSAHDRGHGGRDHHDDAPSLLQFDAQTLRRHESVRPIREAQ